MLRTPSPCPQQPPTQAWQITERHRQSADDGESSVNSQAPPVGKQHHCNYYMLGSTVSRVATACKVHGARSVIRILPGVPGLPSVRHLQLLAGLHGRAHHPVELPDLIHHRTRVGLRCHPSRDVPHGLACAHPDHGRLGRDRRPSRDLGTRRLTEQVQRTDHSERDRDGRDQLRRPGPARPGRHRDTRSLHPAPRAQQGSARQSPAPRRRWTPAQRRRRRRRPGARRPPRQTGARRRTHRYPRAGFGSATPSLCRLSPRIARRWPRAQPCRCSHDTLLITVPAIEHEFDRTAVRGVPRSPDRNHHVSGALFEQMFDLWVEAG